MTTGYSNDILLERTGYLGSGSYLKVLPGQVWAYRSGTLEMVVAVHSHEVVFLGSGRTTRAEHLQKEAALVYGPGSPWARAGFELEP